MASLRERLAEQKQQQVAPEIERKIGQMGGSLRDRMAMRANKPEGLTDRFKALPSNEERKRLLAEINDDMSTWDTLKVSAGRGMMNVARGFGLVDDEPEIAREALADLGERQPIATTVGETIGEAAPFLAAAPLTGAGLTMGAGRTLLPAATRTGSKVLGGAILGAAEGGVITRGRGEDAAGIATGAGVGGAIGGAAEAIFPVIGRLGGALYRQLGRRAPDNLLTPDGQPTAEFAEVLRETNTSLDDLTDEAAKIVQQGAETADPAQLARATRFTDQGIPASRGDISQDFKAVTEEERLLSSAADEGAEPFRQFKLDQAQAFEQSVNDLVTGLGVPDDAGDSIKAALAGRRKVMKAEQKELYKQVFDADPRAGEIPIFTGGIKDALPDEDALDRFSDLKPGEFRAVEKLLKRYNIMPGGESTKPLTLKNFEGFRQALNDIQRSDMTGTISNLTGPLIRSLDEQMDVVGEALEQAGDVSSGVVSAVKQARALTREIKTEFSEKDIVGKLIAVNRKDGVTPLVESSKVANQLLRPTAPIEHLQRTVRSLTDAGADGQKGLKDLQAAAVMQALEKASKAITRKTSGVQTIGFPQFAKALEDLGGDRLEVLFTGNEGALKRLRGLAQTAKDISPDGKATLKGSAPQLLDSIKRIGRMRGLAPFVDAVGYFVRAGADDRAARRAMRSSPARREAIQMLRREYPALATAVGVSSATRNDEEE